MTGTTAVFVYGTLRPGDAAWDVVAGDVVAVTPARTGGALYDTGAGYPAARFDVSGTISGVVLWVGSAALPALDRYEAVEAGLFRRVGIEVATDAGPVTAWGYEYALPTDGFVKIPGGEYPLLGGGPSTNGGRDAKMGR